jgi:hypothetical protein
MRELLLSLQYRKYADTLYWKICLEDSPKFFLWKWLWRAIVELRYCGLRIGGEGSAKKKAA